MDASVEAVYGDIVLKLKTFVVEEGENGISVSQNFVYAFTDTIGDVNGSNRVKKVIDISTREVPAPPETENDIVLTVIYCLTAMENFGCSMLYLILNLMLGMDTRNHGCYFYCK